MTLSGYLQHPICIGDRTDLQEIRQRLKREQQSFVFYQKEEQYYPIKSVTLLLLEDHDTSWDPDGLTNSEPLTVLDFDELTLRALDVLAQEVTLVRHEGQLKYIQREDFFFDTVLSASGDELSWLRSIFSSMPRGLMIVDLDYQVVKSNAEAHRMLRTTIDELRATRMHELLGLQYFQYVQRTQNNLLNQVIYTQSSQAAILVDFVPLITNRVMTGFALVLQDLPSVEAMAMELDSVRRLNEDLNAILSTIYDEIIVVDARGKLLRASENYITAQWDEPPRLRIGAVLPKAMVSDHLISRVIREVQKHNRKVSMMGKHDDAPVLAVGNPVFTESGTLQRIVIASRDLTEVSRLQRELETTRRQRESYRRELEQLRGRVSQVGGAQPVYTSQAMHEVIQKVERVAPFSATVLLQGESGVGKEVIANTLHSFSDRRNRPMIKINCSAIPESLLESELFGYERGAFSGANPQGKQGLFVKADKGTLFLDEISEIPLSIQVKLLRAVQEREVYPIGATDPVRFDTRIIVATNRSLPDLVAQGKFREDLFYRINVFPIDIPPLRDRKEDVAVLANHFLFQFNETYKRDLRYANAALELLEAYDWPGNVRELQNIVQRVAISCNEPLIESTIIERILMKGKVPAAQPFHFSQVVPLKQALAQVEDQLIRMAMDRYKSTTQAARALGVDQSTVSRKYRGIVSRHTTPNQ